MLKETEMLYKMMLIREFENIVAKYKFDRKIYGSAHCYNGQEAIATGVCTALSKDDYVITNHRPHGHAIAKGADINKLMAEIFGKATGSNGGKGGSMHVNCAQCGVITASGIVGSGLPVACGSAFSSKYKNDGKVTVVFFGDGSANEGVLHECLNLASIWNLPLVFVLEDNGLAITVQTKNTSACKDYTKLAKAFGVDSVLINGQDVQEVYSAAQQAVKKARKLSRPTLIQAKTYRFHEHAEGEFYLRMRDTNYRDNKEIDNAKTQKCPIKLYCKKLIENNEANEREISELHKKVLNEVEYALEFAQSSPYPKNSCAFENVFFGGIA